MKPFIIFKELKDNKVELTKEEFVYQTPVTCSTSDDSNCKNIKAEAAPILGCL